MSYKSDLQQNNADLQAVLKDVNDLPDAFIPTGIKRITENGTHDVKSYASVEVNVASGGGGGGVNTCTVIFKGISNGENGVTIYKNGEFGVLSPPLVERDVPIENVVCGSAIQIRGNYLMASATAGTIIRCGAAGIIYQAPTTPNVTAVVTAMQD